MEAINSADHAARSFNYEIIVINDGSTDHETISLLNNLISSNVIILNQSNKGVAAARNSGVKISRGEYLFFLDSDNMVRENYIRKGTFILKENQRVGVVYACANFFGESSLPRFSGQPFDPFKLVMNNYIDSCTLVRKKVWLDVGGFDENIILIGYEDWDFWLSIAKTPWKFFYLDEIAFDYRIRNNSLIAKKRIPGNKSKVDQFIFNKHRNFIMENYKKMYNKISYQKKYPLKSFIKTVLKTVGLREE